MTKGVKGRPRAPDAGGRMGRTADYQSGPERKVVSLEHDGVPCVPLLGFDDFRSHVKASPLHSHANCIEISYCARGDLVFELGGVEYPFRPGNVFVSLPGEKHRLSTWPYGISKYWVLLRVTRNGFPGLRLSSKETKWLMDEFRHLPRRMFEDVSGVRETFRRLFRLYETDGMTAAERTFRIRAAATDLALATVDSAKAPSRVHPDLKLRAVAEEMRGSPEMRFDLLRKAEECGMSRSSFETRFKKSFGYSPRAYLVRCRMDAAKRLLAAGKSVGYVANFLGYGAARHFSERFKAITGKTPREAREILRQTH